jgi:hypothetical protein
MFRERLLVVTAVIEVGAGLMLLCFPSPAFTLMLGVEPSVPATILIARIAGGALIGLGAACRFGRNEAWSRSTTAVIAAMLLYNVLIAGLFAYAGACLRMSGVLLWPAVRLHTVMAVWCVACLVARPPVENKQMGGGQ